MNMNDKEWNDFFDSERIDEDDDDDYNDIASDIDANNDETFGNAAEDGTWNENEHEELIARDPILSHKTSRNNHSSNSNHNISQQHQRQQQHHHHHSSNITNHGSSSNNNVFPATPGRRQVLTVDELEQQLLQARISQNNVKPQTSTSNQPQNILGNDVYKRSGWSPFGGKDIFAGSSSSSSPAQVPISSLNHNLIIGNQLPQSLTLEQQQRLLIHQHHLLQQQQQQLQQQQLQQMALNQALSPQCFTVEELERQMFASRSNNNTKRDESLPPQQPPQPPQQRHFAFVAAAAAARDLETSTRAVKQNNHELKVQNNINDNNKSKRDGERQECKDRFERELKEPRAREREHRESRNFREPRDFKERQRENHHRDHHRDRDHRDHHQHHHNYGRDHHRQSVTIIPPQVQLKVIEKAKRLYSITTMHPDEFMQDSMPTSENGFLFKRHSVVSEKKANHDGILTEKERNWLTKIQEKIQADYDDNLDQDYYYLLYFNRSSMTNEAAQKPCGPGVLDRRFIPRERLLYNTGT